jgi:phosphoserine phosphatase
MLVRTLKLNAFNRFCDEKGLKLYEVLAVSEGVSDIKMMEVAGLSVTLRSSNSL